MRVGNTHSEGQLAGLSLSYHVINSGAFLSPGEMEPKVPPMLLLHIIIPSFIIALLVIVVIIILKKQFCQKLYSRKGK